MGDILRSVTGAGFELDGLTDEQLDSIIGNTQAQQRQMTAFYNSLINERVRRGLKLPKPRESS